jgi:hypothetical protein
MEITFVVKPWSAAVVKPWSSAVVKPWAADGTVKPW